MPALICNAIHCGAGAVRWESGCGMAGDPSPPGLLSLLIPPLIKSYCRSSVSLLQIPLRSHEAQLCAVIFTAALQRHRKSAL